MLLLANIPNQRAAQAFIDYLKLQNIDANLQNESPNELGRLEWEIWVEPEGFHQAQTFYQEFVANPNDAKYLEASWQVGQPQTQTSQSFGMARIWRSAGSLTRFITLLCASVFLLSWFGFYGFFKTYFSFTLELTEFYRIVTPAFMHLSAMHIVFNLCWWWYLGGRIEKVLGKQTLLVIVVLSAASSNVAQALLVNANFAGLSGVNYALAGFTWYCGVFHQSRSIFLPNNIFIFLVGWMILGFLDILPVAMANWAHLFGLIAGIVLANIMVKPEPRT